MIMIANIRRLKENLNDCPVCGGRAEILDYVENQHGKMVIHGIGDITCPNRDKSFHYSGMFGVSKKEAIGKWNYWAESYIKDERRIEDV